MAQLPVTIVEDMTAIAGEVRHSGCTKAVLSEHAVEQSAVFRLSPGGMIQSRLHSRVFDLFMLIRAPFEGYDFVPVEFRTKVRDQP